MEHDSALPGSDAEQVVKSIGIPPCPAILTKLLREMREEDPDLNKVGKLIGSDLSLSAAVLKTVNSPSYGLGAKATSVYQALNLIGLRNAAHLVTGLLLRDAFQGGSSHAMDEFWESSSTIALLNASLARKLKVIDREEAYTFALFRDCGALAMMVGATKYRAMLPGASTMHGKQLTEFETERYRVNHAVTGYYLTRSWHVPEPLCEAVLHHHHYMALHDGTLRLAAPVRKHIALALAAQWLYVTRTLGLECGEWKEGSAFALETLGISEADLSAVVDELSRAA